MSPPSSERLNGLALMTIHKDIHFKYGDVIDQYVMQQNLVVYSLNGEGQCTIQFCAVAEQTLIFGIFSK